MDLYVVELILVSKGIENILFIRFCLVSKKFFVYKVFGKVRIFFFFINKSGIYSEFRNSLIS